MKKSSKMEVSIQELKGIVARGVDGQFIANPQLHRLSEATRTLVDQYLLERLSLAAIVPLTGVSKRYLQYYVNAHYASQAQQAVVTVKKRTLDAGMRRVVDFCRQETTESVGLGGF